jgi:hypothetical protein
MSKQSHIRTRVKKGDAYPDGVVVVPSDLLGELAEEAVLVPRLQPQNPIKHTEKITIRRGSQRITSQ